MKYMFATECSKRAATKAAMGGMIASTLSAALEEEHLERALEAFERVGRELGLLRSSRY